MIRVQREDFDLGAEISRMTKNRHGVGGVCAFTGLVRDMAPDSGKPGSMTLEHYPGMTEKELQRIEAEALDRWPLDDTLIIHRYGQLEAGEQIVLVVATSAHRDAAFEACRFLIDWLKTKAPFWKLEETGDGPRWVDAKETDEAAAARWGQTEQ